MEYPVTPSPPNTVVGSHDPVDTTSIMNTEPLSWKANSDLPGSGLLSHEGSEDYEEKQELHLLNIENVTERDGPEKLFPKDEEQEDLEKHELYELNAEIVIGPDAVDGSSKDDLVVDVEEDVGEIIVKKQSNNFAAKKTVAQGMMDIALITANANQLRYIIEFNSHSSTYILNLTLIIISLVLQIAVGIALIFKGRFDIKGQSKCDNAIMINNYVIVGVFLITIINVFIASFTVTGNSAITVT